MTNNPIDPPLGICSQQFQTHLEGQFYSRDTIARYSQCLAALNEAMKARRIDPSHLSEETAVTLIAGTGLPSYMSKHNLFMVRSFVRFLQTLGVCAPPPEAMRDDSMRGVLRRDYAAYLRRQRGLTERTIFHMWRLADRFLNFRFGADDDPDFAVITATDITAFLQQTITRKPPLRDKTLSSHLRNFFRYLFQAGKINLNLAEGIPSVAQRYGARLPRHLTPEQVDTLIKAVRLETPAGRRNHAMVLLIARLGLRAPEIVAMQLDDIDWRAGEIIVRGKGQLHDRVPLVPEVGEALADYIRRDRKASSRSLFVTDRPPHGPFKDGQVLNNILRDAFRRTGLKPPAPYVGSHILRHSLATTLVRRGAPLEEIGDMLRHRSRASTMIYAKLDIDGLRSVAQPWPIVGGAQ